MPLPALDGQKTSLTFRKRINGTAGSDQPSASIAVTSSQGIPNDDREVSCSARLRRSLRSGRIPPGAVPEKDHRRPVRAGGAPDNLSSGTAGSAADNRAPVNRLREDDPREAEGSLAVGGDSRTRCKDRGRRIVV